MFEITVEGYGAGQVPGPQHEAARTACRLSEEYAGRKVTLARDGQDVAAFVGGRKVIRKVAGFASADAPVCYTTTEYVPEPGRKVGFGLAA